MEEKKQPEKKNKLAIISFLLCIIPSIIILVYMLIYPIIKTNLLDMPLYLLMAITPFLCIASIIIAVISLKQIKKTKEKGLILSLAGIIAGIIIFFVVSSYVSMIHPSKIVQDQCVSTAGIECKSYEVDLTNSRMSLAFANNMDKAIMINSVNITSRGIAVATCTDNQIIDSNEAQITQANPAQTEKIFMFRNCTLLTENTPLSEKKPGDKVKLDFNFKYHSIKPVSTEQFAQGTLIATAR